MGIQLKNNASGTLATAISASDTGIVLTTGNGASFPTLGATDYFYATLESTGGTFEVIKVTVRSGDSMTVVRAQEGSTANSFAAGSRIELRVTAASVLEAIGDVEALQVGVTPYGWIAATNLQAALEEVVDDLGASSGSGLIGFQQAGGSAVLRTTQAKLREAVSVKDFGAVGNGVTDDTAAIQAAVNTGGTIYFPDGTYEITHVDLSSNTQLIGESWNTIIHQISGTNPRPGSVDGMFVMNLANNQTPIKDVVFRSIQFRMDLPTGAYTPADEQSHIILGGHTENIIVDNCFFYGWRGDAIFVGSQMSGVGVPTNYAAQNTTITNCRFDGINNTCRQGVTGGSVDGLYIFNNYFVNTTNATMPGAVDVEPELSGAYARNISVTNNIFVGIGPVGFRRRAVIFDLGNLNLASTERRGNITVADNYMNTSNGVRVMGAKITTNINFISNWIFGTDDTMSLTNVDGLVVADNYFEDCATILIGFSTSGAEVKNASIYGNTFQTCGVTAAALQVNTVTNGSICDNQFIDCGAGGDLTAIRFAGGGTQTGITVHDNVFTTPNAITVNALMSSGTQDAESLYHNNIFKNNINPGDWQNGFYLNGNGMISSTTVSFAANANTILYYVPPNKKLVLTKAVVIAGADAGATTTISIGQSTSTTDFIPANTLSNLDAANDAVILQPIPNTTPLKSRAYPAGSIISCTVATASGGATNTVQLYGTFI